MRRSIALFALSFSIAGCGGPGAAVSPSLGSLVTHDHVVVIEQTADGLRYSVETRDGELVAEGLTREGLERLAPGAARHLETGTGLLAN